MLLNDRIALLAALGDSIQSDLNSNRLENVLGRAYSRNAWFVEKYSKLALQNVAQYYLNAEALTEWLSAYTLDDHASDKRVGLIPAGNIPLVGIHDLISIFASGNTALIKPSSKDEVLTKYVIEALYELEPRAREHVILSERLTDFDAVIATGSNNTHRYFEHYFGKYPNVLRRNRTSVAVLDENTSAEDIRLLGEDVFTFFGLGCRSVSKVFVPKGFAIERMLKEWDEFSWLGDHNKFHNNYMYHKSVYLVNKVSHFDTGFALVSESDELFSPIGAIYYEEYDGKDELNSKLTGLGENVQVVVSGPKMSVKGSCGYGMAQSPTLNDYADNIDTINFLASLRR